MAILDGKNKAMAIGRHGGNHERVVNKKRCGGKGVKLHFALCLWLLYHLPFPQSSGFNV